MTITAKQRENLLVLANILEEADGRVLQSECANDGKPVEFYMGWWGNNKTYFDQTRKKAPECGTSACALGYAAMHDHFRAQGLTHKWGDRDAGPGLAQYRIVGDGIELFGRRAWDSVFCMNQTSENATPKTVARQLRHIAETEK